MTGGAGADRFEFLDRYMGRRRSRAWIVGYRGQNGVIQDFNLSGGDKIYLDLGEGSDVPVFVGEDYDGDVWELGCHALLGRQHGCGSMDLAEEAWKDDAILTITLKNFPAEPWKRAISFSSRPAARREAAVEHRRGPQPTAIASAWSRSRIRSSASSMPSRQAHEVGGGAGGRLLLGVEQAVGGRGGDDDQRPRIPRFAT